MKYKTTNIFLFSTLLLILFYNSLFSQVVADTFYVPNYPIPEIYYTDEAPELPENVWNHKLKYFPDSIIGQIGSTCGQASGIFNCMTYMFNRAYDRKADSSNIFPPNHTYNQISTYYGVSFFDSWNIVISQGHPSQENYETINLCSNQYIDDFNSDHWRQYWMQGYENYYNSFKNRISGYYSLNLSTDQDLLLLKHYLDNVFGYGECGGIAVFASQPFTETTPIKTLDLLDIAINETNVRFYVLDTIRFYQRPTHQMTIVGYYKNDSVDFNGDGLITDTIDLNNDGIIDMHDNETTLWIALNSWGNAWSYFLLKYDLVQLFWNQQVFFPIPDTNYQPELTFKIKLKHPSRGDIKISAGISSDLESERPEIEIDFPVFNFQGSDICLTGIDSLDEPDILEFGIDISDLKNHIPESGNYKVFMQIENKGYNEGEIQYFSIIDYSQENINESVIINSPQEISSDTKYIYNKTIYLEKGENENYLFVNNLSTHTVNLGDSIQVPINTEYGTPPFSYHLLQTNEYTLDFFYEPFPDFPEIDYDTVILKEVLSSWEIPFSDELFNSFYIESYGHVSFHSNMSPFIERYPYEINKRKYDYLEVSPYRSMTNSLLERPIAVNQTESEINIYIKRNTYWPDYNIVPYIYLKITKEGKIEVHYNTVSDYNSPILSTHTNKYYIPYNQEIPDTYNTVTFTPNPADSLFTIDENGILTMQAVSEPGKYETYVLVRDADGQEFTKRIEVNVINDNIIGKLYPNPTKDILYCDIYNPTNQNATIEVFTISGQCIYKETTTLPAGITEHNFNTTQFRQGVYLLRISMGNKSQTQRFVVTK